MDNFFYLFVRLVILSFAVILLIVICRAIFGNSKSSPSAMDVYQGKTTLEITYKNGVPVDSVVVFKEEE